MAIEISEIDMKIEEQKRKLEELEQQRTDALMQNTEERNYELLKAVKVAQEALIKVREHVEYFNQNKIKLNPETEETLGNEFDKLKEIADSL
jgi:outer membrane protein OmpA-like peptidoglycan-associated protein